MNRSQRLLAGFFVLAGAMHFLLPRSSEAIVPPRLRERRREVVQVSGLAEIAGGAAVAASRSRHLGRWWLLTLLAAVFPANVHMAVNPEQIPGLDLNHIPRWALWARLPSP